MIMSRKGAHKEFTEQEVLEAVYGSNGIMSVVAGALKCHWHTAQKWVKAYPSAIEAMAAEVEISLDLAEKKIHEAISMDDVGSAKWYLSKKGRSRGYGDEVAFTGNIAITGAGAITPEQAAEVAKIINGGGGS